MEDAAGAYTGMHTHASKCSLLTLHRAWLLRALLPQGRASRPHSLKGCSSEDLEKKNTERLQPALQITLSAGAGTSKMFLLHMGLS